MQYLHENSNMHIVIWVANCNICIVTLKSHYKWERRMQYLHDIFKMHIVWGAKCNTHIITLNLHYLWERKMQYLHDNLNMHIVCG
jgi:hypothetical protein